MHMQVLKLLLPDVFSVSLFNLGGGGIVKNPETPQSAQCIFNPHNRT